MSENWPEHFHALGKIENLTSEKYRKLADPLRKWKELMNERARLEDMEKREIDSVKYRYIHEFSVIDRQFRSMERMVENVESTYQRLTDDILQECNKLTYVDSLPMQNLVPCQYLGQLFKYQVALVNRMLFISNNYPSSFFIGNLGNKVGTGKTRTALLYSVLMAYDEHKVIIVIPQRLLSHWQSEWNVLKQNVRGLDLIIVHTLRDLKKLEDREPQITIVGLNTHTCYYQEYNCLRNMQNKVIICDEWQTFSNMRSRGLNLGTTIDSPVVKQVWVISATIQAVDPCRELYGYDTTVAASPQFIASEAVIPEAHHYLVDCKGIDSTIRDLIPGQTIDLINQGDIAGALRSVGGSKTHSNIAQAMTVGLEKQIRSSQRKLEEENLTDDEKKTLLDDIKSCEQKRADILERLANTSCPICLTDEEQVLPAITHCCKQRLCLECLMMHLRTQEMCPYCRATLNEKENFSVIHDSEEPRVVPPHRLSKEDALIDIIQKNLDRSILVFSDNGETFLIEHKLKQLQIKSAVLQGSSGRARNLIDLHAAKSFPVLFINRQVCGEGIHLAHSDIIIFYHTLADAYQYQQATARANRLPRTNPLEVYELLANGEKSGWVQ